MVKPQKSLDQLGELQREVLEIVWRLDGASVQDVLDALEPKRKLAYTTVLSTLQNLTKSGWVQPKKKGRAHVYYSTNSRDQADGNSLTEFIGRVFGGSTRSMFQTLLDHEELSDSELVELKKLIEQKRRGNKK